MKRTKYIAIVCNLLFIVGCDATIHEYPEIQEALVVLEPNVSRMQPEYHKLVSYDEKGQCTVGMMEETTAQTYQPEDGYVLRIIADVYEGRIDEQSGERHRVSRRVVITDKDAQPPQDTIHIRLPEGNYYVLAWADYVKEDEEADWHYLTDTLTKIKTNLDTYPANTHHRSSATGSQAFDIDYNLTQEGYPSVGSEVLTSRTVPVNMSRPSGRYRVVALDYDDYLSMGGNPDEMTVKVIYKQYVSVGYNVATGEPNRFVSTYSFNIRPSDICDEGKKEASLFGDYLFTGSNGETNVVADFYFFDALGHEISHSQNIEIPLKRDHETVIAGYFLTHSLGHGDDVSIDDKFDGEFVVEID